MFGEHNIQNIWERFTPGPPNAQRNSHQFPYPLSLCSDDMLRLRHPNLFHPFPDLTVTQHGPNPSEANYSSNPQMQLQDGNAESNLLSGLSAAVTRVPPEPGLSAAVTRASSGPTPSAAVTRVPVGDAVMANLQQLVPESSSTTSAQERTRARLATERAPYAASTDITDSNSAWVPPYEWTNTERPQYTPSFFAQPNLTELPTQQQSSGPL